MTQNIPSLQSALDRNTKALEEVQNQTNNPPLTFRSVRDAQDEAAAAVAAGAANAAELTAKAKELSDTRSELNAQAYKLLGYINSGKDALVTANTAINNLKDAGAVPPGTNQFTPTAGDTQEISQPKQVPPGSNPNADPGTDSQSPANTAVQNVTPATLPDENFGDFGAQPPTDFSPITITSHNDPYLGDAANQPYDDEGNLNPGWQIEDTTGKPFYVGDLPKTPIPEPIDPKSDPAVAATEGTPYDDNGNLNPGWTLDENNNPVYVGGDFVEPSTLALANQSVGDGATRALTAPKLNTQSQATQQDAANFAQQGDWRVRLALAPSADYLYKNKGKEGILLPLAATDGVIFPYTPAISVQYAAAYDGTELTHSNYKFWQYKSSSVDSVSITCDFTAQDTSEANYLLAVIHFFRSVTKMFYGQDQNPTNGTPPPLCYLYGLGSFQFDTHPLAITGFTYTLPTDVDYIRAGATTTGAGVNKSPSNVETQNSNSVSGDRLNNSGLNKGALTAAPQFASNDGTRTPTYVPTKMQIAISAIPIVTRNDISNNFSLNGPGMNYGSGALLQGSKRKGGGIW
jgi:hypothetical protein